MFVAPRVTNSLPLLAGERRGGNRIYEKEGGKERKKREGEGAAQCRVHFLDGIIIGVYKYPDINEFL